jgi:pimeloyl-ACP methyl ester carboxylesterase
MKLFFREFGEGKPMVILHGLFGASDNWHTIAKRIGRFRKLFIVDQRNHGQSPHSPDFNYPSMVADLEEFIEEHQLLAPDLLGHSMGGKVAMHFAVKHPELLSKLIVVDIAPKYYPIHHDVILEGLKAIDINMLRSRQEADEELAEYIEQPGIRQFLLKNLKRNEVGFEWKMNLDVIYSHVANVGEGLQPTDVVDKPTLFVRGGQSRYILDKDIPDIMKHFPNGQIATIDQASHWVHAEQPEQLCRLVESFLQEDE